MFDSLEDLEKRIDDPDLNVTPQTVMVLRNAGPIGAPGMPEAGALPIPKKLGSKGLKDMVRHVRRAHERHRVRHRGAARVARRPRPAGRWRWCATATGSSSTPRAASSTSRSTTPSSRKRRAQWKPPQKPARGYVRLYTERVTQAEHGCDFDFLAGEKA